ncbi:hypothetical protein V3C99_013810 [Haemonchus contortus]|uniref:Spicule matrix protein n=1 Tax=Haemonchus contortus TaxID=6289 RepID=A0A7I5EES1_HAECO
MKATVPLVFAVLIALSSCQGQEIPLGPGPVVEGNQGGGPQGGFGGNQGGFPGQQGGFGPERFGGNQGGFPGQQQGGFAPQGFGGNQGGFPGQQPGGFGPESFGGNQGGFPGQPGQGGFQGFPRRRRELQETGYGHDTLKRLLR